jgi:hypothetical protein
MLAAPKLLGSIRVLACGVRRLAEQSFRRDAGKLHAGTRALPGPTLWPLSPIFGNDF